MGMIHLNLTMIPVILDTKTMGILETPWGIDRSWDPNMKPENNHQCGPK